jgi:cyclase
MLRTRIIPVLLLREDSLVKTRRFGRFRYVGDPCNTVRIFNELEVDELTFLDITATIHGSNPNFELLADIADECFMPLGYGGGVRTREDAAAILRIGFEKVILNAAILENPSLISRLADAFGSQAIVASIDVKRTPFGRYEVRKHGGRIGAGLDPVAWAKEAAERGAGEILLTAIDREGTWDGFDLQLIRSVTDAVDIPVIAHGGAGKVADIGLAVKNAGASAVALGSMVVFQKKGMGVLVNFPPADALAKVLS